MFHNNHYKAILSEVTINMIIFILFPVLYMFSLKSNFELNELSLSLTFSIFSCLYIFSNLKKFNNHKFEFINQVIFISNILSLMYVIISALGYIYETWVIEQSVSIHLYNLLIQYPLMFIAFYNLYNIDNYMDSARSDLMIKNTYYQGKGKSYRAKPEKIQIKRNDKLTIAHEVGHLMQLLPTLEEKDELLISVIPDSNAYGYVFTNYLKSPKKKSEYEIKMRFYLGGMAAEKYENIVNKLEEETGRKSDLKAYSNLSIDYLKNGFLNGSLYISELEDKFYSENKKMADEINIQTVESLYQKNYLEAYLNIEENKEVYEELKKLLENKKALYTEDIIHLKNKLKTKEFN